MGAVCRWDVTVNDKRVYFTGGVGELESHYVHRSFVSSFMFHSVAEFVHVVSNQSSYTTAFTRKSDVTVGLKAFDVYFLASFLKTDDVAGVDVSDEVGILSFISKESVDV